MGIKLFIADDEEKVIDGIANTIGSEFDDDIKFASNPDKAIDQIREFMPDIIITDINFSSGNDPSESDPLSIAGVELARKIRKEFPLTKIIASSGYRNDDIVFSKITDRDWYDEFYTKGNKNLIEIYSKVRDEVLTYITGLIPKLCKAFAPTQYDLNGTDFIDKRLYRLTHFFDKGFVEWKEYIDDIEEHYLTFSNCLQDENKRFLDNVFESLKSFQRLEKRELDKIETKNKLRELGEEIKKELKERFYFKYRNLIKINEDSSEEIFAEKKLINEIWNKIESETNDHCKKPEKFDLFGPSVDDKCIKYWVVQSKRFDFIVFIEKRRTIKIYKDKIKNYGHIYIYSGTKMLDVLSEKIQDSGEVVKGTRIEMILKKIPTVKEYGSKR